MQLHVHTVSQLEADAHAHNRTTSVTFSYAKLARHCPVYKAKDDPLVTICYAGLPVILRILMAISVVLLWQYGPNSPIICYSRVSQS